MTGYGAAKGSAGGQSVTIEIRSLNSKFLELNLRLPQTFRDRELEIRSDLSRLLERGKADVNITLDNNDLSRRSTINREIFSAYYEELNAIRSEFNIPADGMMDAILKLPAVLNSDKTETDETQWKELKDLLSQAVLNFNNFRQAEGKVLEQDLISRLQAIENAIPVIESHEGNRTDIIRQRMQKHLAELKDQTAVDENRFEQELIYYIEKLDISEEKVRLKSHCDYFLQTLRSPEANGKKLGFIAQEIGREINTIGAKANDAAMQRTVVEMKDELEKLKEQLANVL